MNAIHKRRRQHWTQPASGATSGGRINTALVISGGGAKGAFAVGVIKRIYERYRDSGWFSIVGGSSTGALIASAAAVLGGPDRLAREALETLVECYTERRTSDILRRNGILGYLHRPNYLNGSAPLRKLLYEKMRQEWFDWLQSDSAPACYVVYTDFCSGEKIAVSPRDPGVDRERFIEATLASASVPILMEPTFIDGKVCYDGGVRDVLPMERAIELGAERIVPILLDPEKMEHAETDLRSMKDVAFRTVMICMDEIVRNDYLQAAYLQKAAAFRKALVSKLGYSKRKRRTIAELCERPEFSELFGSKTRVIDILEGVRPDRLMTYDMLTFEPELMRQWLQWGEAKADTVFTADPFRRYSNPENLGYSSV